MSVHRQWSGFGIGCGVSWALVWGLSAWSIQDPQSGGRTNEQSAGAVQASTTSTLPQTPGSVATLQIPDGELPAAGRTGRDPEKQLQPQALDWVQRVELLERRMNEMEQILLTTSQITALEAERRLRDAKTRLADSRKLFLQGQVAEIEFQNDRFEVDRLTRELELSRGTNTRHQMMSQIEIANAEQQLFAARQDLEQTETLVRRGYASATQIDRDREFVDLATRRLELAKQRLEAAKRLDELNRKQPSAPAEPPK